MLKAILTTAKTWGAVLLVAFGLIVPSTSLAHHSPEMDHHKHSSTDCMGDECEPQSSADLSCLEHCLQATSQLSEEDPSLHAGTTTAVLPPANRFENAPQRVTLTPHKTGPPPSKKLHITTQKRE